MTSVQIDINSKDGLSSATAIKGPVRVATTGNITLSGEQTIDGVAVVTDDRVLVKDQTTGSENGIYIADTGPWRRSKDFNKTRDVKQGTLVFVTGGTVGTGLWELTTADPISVGTTSITFAQSVLLASQLIDEDDMASNSATKVPTQQSVKAYVDYKTPKMPTGIVLNDSTPAVAAANRAAIQAVLDASGPGDVVMLPNGPIYIGTSGLNVFNGQMLSGFAPSGNIFGGTVTAGTALLWAGAAAEPWLVAFGANPASSPGTTQTFGGGLANLQIDGAYNVDRPLRIAACGRARFDNLKVMRPTISSSGKAIWLGANTTVSGLENTIRNCDFNNVSAFAYGAGSAFYNQSNGTEGGLTFCTGRNLRADFGYGTGSGHGFYFSSMDDCTFESISAGRAAGGTGQGLYLNGNGASGIVVVGNTFSQVKLSGGCPVLADGANSNQNKIYGLSGVDEVPTVIESNDGWVDVEYLGTGYSSTQSPGSVSQQPTTVRAKNTANAAVTRMLTLSHDLNPGASAPAAGIGTSLAFEALTGTGNKELAAVLEASMTDVTSTAEISKLVLKLMSAGTSTSFVTFTPTLVSMIGVNPSYYIESTGVGAGASAGMSMKTGNHANVWQAVTKAGTYVVGVQSVADYLVMDTSGNLTQNAALKSSHATAGLGYATGAGGTVTQATSKSTGVTLNKATGQITMNAAALASAAKVSFVVTNSAVAATDTVLACVASGGTANAYRAAVTAVAAGSFTVTVENITAGSLSEAPVISYAVVKAVTA